MKEKSSSLDQIKKVQCTSFSQIKEIENNGCFFDHFVFEYIIVFIVVFVVFVVIEGDDVIIFVVVFAKNYMIVIANVVVGEWVTDLRRQL